MSDQRLICKECGEDFNWTEGEQEFFAKQGFTPPKRCPACRKAKRDKKKQY